MLLEIVKIISIIVASLIIGYWSFALIVVILDAFIKDYLLPKLTLKNNKENYLNQIRNKRDGHLLRFGNEIIRSDFDIVLEALRISGEYHQYSPFHYASYQLRSNRVLVIQAVKIDGLSLEYASEKLQDDDEVVIEAIRKRPDALQFASMRLRDDEKIALFNDISLKHLSTRLRSKKEIVMEKVKKSKSLECELKYASEILQNDFDVVMTAVMNHGGFLEYASENLRDNWEIVMHAIENYPKAFKFASSRLQIKLQNSKTK